VGEKSGSPVSEIRTRIFGLDTSSKNAVDANQVVEVTGGPDPGEMLVKTFPVSEIGDTKQGDGRVDNSALDALDGSQSPFAIAADPVSHPLPFRPKRTIRKPQKYLD